MQIGEGDAIYCMVRGGRLEARFVTQAFYALADAIEETQSGFGLRVAGALHAIGTRPR